MTTPVYRSNGAKIADGMRITLVSEGGTKFEIWTGDHYSEIILKPDPVPTPTPTPTPVISTGTSDGSATGSAVPVTATLPTPPIVGTTNVFGTSELLTKLASAPGGETLVAKPAAYGQVNITGVKPTSRVTVLFEDGAQAESIRFRSSANIKLDRPQVWPVTFIPSTTVGLVASDAASTGIVVANADVRSKVDAPDYYNWDLARWALNPAFGITLAGPDSSIEDCRITATDIAISIGGVGSQMVRNKVRGFSQDGMRMVGNGAGWLIQGNDVADAVTITSGGAHSDGFQAWSRIVGQAAGTGLLSNIVVEDNIWRSWIGSKPRDPAMVVGMQGIGWHNGAFQNVIIRRNIYWGGSFNGANLYNIKDLIMEDNAFYDIGRANMQFGMIRVNGTNIVANRNVAGIHGYPAGSITSGNTQPDYATLPPMPTV